MMVLVDTSVWIDFFAAKPFKHIEILESLIGQRNDICICGIILTEVLQGIRDAKDYDKTKDLFENLICLPMSYSIFIRSAEIYRSLSRHDITLRKSIDCMIASVAIENDLPILHNDKDFYPIEKHCGLRSIKRME